MAGPTRTRNTEPAPPNPDRTSIASWVLRVGISGREVRGAAERSFTIHPSRPRASPLAHVTTAVAVQALTRR